MNIQRIPNITTMQGIDSTLAKLDDGTFIYICQAARVTGTTRSTIYRHLNSGHSKREA